MTSGRRSSDPMADSFTFGRVTSGLLTKVQRRVEAVLSPP